MTTTHSDETVRDGTVGTRTAPRSPWVALYVLCVGVLMIVLDGSVVNVALPSIRDDLGFSPSSLAWVVNGYLLTYGGLLLFCGRLGDLRGNRRVFLAGTALFTLASVTCGLATSAQVLVVGRIVQGCGGAAVTAVGLALIMGLFPDTADRARAMGIYGFVLSGGGAIGVLLGGVLTDRLSWHWIFLVNVPIGVAVLAAARSVLPRDAAATERRHLDLPGAVLVTAALMLAVSGIVGGGEAGRASARTLGLLAGSAVLFAAFVAREARAPEPLVPLRVVTMRNLAVSQVVGTLWTAAMFGWFFLTALYLQDVLGLAPLRVGLAFLPASLVQAACSLWISDRLVLRFGVKPPMVIGLSLAGAGLVLLAVAPVEGTFVVNVLPSMLLLGLGAGIAFNPVLMAATSDVEPHEAGLASGVLNTAFMLGGALGLAVLVAVSDGRRGALLAAGSDQVDALNGGLHAGFVAGALAAFAAAVVGQLLLRPTRATGTTGDAQSDAQAPENPSENPSMNLSER
jgi:EmrB/QacA subfamily drug resistance transporter